MSESVHRDSSPVSASSNVVYRGSLRRELTLLISALIIVPVLISGLILGLGARSTLRRQILATLSATADVTAGHLLEEIQVWLNDAESFSSRDVAQVNIGKLGVSARTEGTPEFAHVQDRLEHLTSFGGQRVGDALILDLKGRPVVWEGLTGRQARMLARGYDVAVLLRTQSAHLGETYRDPFTGNARVDVFKAMTALDSDRLTGVLIRRMYIDQTTFPTLRRVQDIGTTGDFVLTTREGLGLMGRELPPEVIWKTVETEPVRRAITGQPGTVVATDYLGRPVLAAYRQVPLTGWGLITKLRTYEAFAPMYRLTYLWLAAMALLIVAGLLLAVATARRLAGPITQLSTASRRITEGDLTVRVQTRRQDELGQLTHDFNIMADQVQNVHATLEKHVAERTAALTAANTDLRRMNEEMTAFTYSVSHDLASPLVSLQGLAGLLLRDYSDKLDDEGKRRLGRLQVNVQMMESLVSDLLELSRIGRIEGQPGHLNLASAIADVMSSLHESLEERHIQVTIPAADDCPAVRLDANRLRQVLSNLVGNAIKYGATAPEPRIEIACAPESERFVRITVRDNGPGIDQSHHARVFQPFMRLPGSRDQAGTGMGLAIVKKIVEHYGGRIWVESELGAGTAFHFTLPKAG